MSNDMKIDSFSYPKEKAILTLSPKKLALAFDDEDGGKYAKVIDSSKTNLRLQLDEGATIDVETTLTMPDGSKIQPLTRLYFDDQGTVLYATISEVKAVKEVRPARQGSMTEPNLTGIRR